MTNHKSIAFLAMLDTIRVRSTPCLGNPGQTLFDQRRAHHAWTNDVKKLQIRTRRAVKCEKTRPVGLLLLHVFSGDPTLRGVVQRYVRRRTYPSHLTKAPGLAWSATIPKTIQATPIKHLRKADRHVRFSEAHNGWSMAKVFVPETCVPFEVVAAIAKVEIHSVAHRHFEVYAIAHFVHCL
eukprot:6187194-Pleurochrysis_carterae.AAC.2